MGLVEQGVEEEEQPALSPVSAEGWACFPGNIDPGSDGRYLKDNNYQMTARTHDEKTGSVILLDQYLQVAQRGHPEQTAPTSGVTTASRSTPGCQTYRGDRQGT